MLHSTTDLNGFWIAATDGELGTVEDVYFDDENWTIRHFVVDTGGWLGGRKVLISPLSFAGWDWSNELMQVNLTRQQVEDSPGIDTARPVSRQHEMQLYDHFGYPYYWTGPFVWGATVFPGVVEAGAADEQDIRRAPRQTEEELVNADPHLRSAKEVAGYRVRATDEAVGHVEDFLFDDESWSIQLIVVDPRDWWPGKHVMIAPQRITEVSWGDQSIAVNLTRDEVEHSPQYDAMNPPPFPPQYDLYRDVGNTSFGR